MISHDFEAGSGHFGPENRSGDLSSILNGGDDMNAVRLLAAARNRMAVLRSDIERALDDLISNEDGMKFQGLAVVLAKKRWPDLVASERK